MELLYQSKYFAIRQCDQKRCFCFETEYKSVHLSCCQLLALRDKVRSMDLEAHFDEERNRNGIEILTFCNREHLIVLDTYQVIDLKFFMEATFALLQGASVSRVLA